MKVLSRPLSSVRPYPGNPRHAERAAPAVAASIKRYGWRVPIVVDAEGTIIAGHARYLAARLLGLARVPVHVAADLPPERVREYRLADNKAGELAGWDAELLDLEMAALGPDVPWADLGWTGADVARLWPDETGGGGEDGEPGDAMTERGSDVLRERFLVPPVSVLNARDGRWIERKRAWLALGIVSELGRGGEAGRAGGGRTFGENIMRGEQSGALTYVSLSGRVPDYYKQKRAAERDAGRRLTNAEFEASGLLVMPAAGTISSVGTSIFDPVLCELAYRWFSPPGGTVLDPYAGGSVRGVVAALLGRRYVGVDLREEQVAANRAQGEEIVPAAGPPDAPAPEWRVGDSRDLAAIAGDVEADLVFTCPPYGDLEVYSDDPRDLSRMKWPAFLAAYRAIAAAAVDRLRPDRFAVVVVGDVRARDGGYRGLVAETIRAFEDAGARLYNEAIYVTPLGSVPVRCGAAFASGRKLGKTHQNVLVFVKGSGRRAADAAGPVEVAEVPSIEADGAPGED